MADKRAAEAFHEPELMPQQFTNQSIPEPESSKTASMGIQSQRLRSVGEGSLGFTPRTMSEQVRHMLNQSPISQVLWKLIDPELMPQVHEQEIETKDKRYITMVNSMIEEVLDSADPAKLMNKDRMIQVAQCLEEVDECALSQAERLQSAGNGSHSFTLRAMCKQFQYMLNQDSISQALSKFPTFEPQSMPQGHEQKMEAKVRRYMTMMNAMADEELDSADPTKFMNKDRIMEVARCSGFPVKDVVEMLEEHKRMAQLLIKMKGLKNSMN